MPDAIDWAGVARGSKVIVMYMAMKHIDTIAKRLIAEGRSSDEPVAFVCDASTDRQSVLETTLGDAAKDVEASGLKPPAIVVVGEVVRLRKGLDWYSALKDGHTLVPDPLGVRSKGESA
jgi:uroporphyrin-III C-methyltransferase